MKIRCAKCGKFFKQENDCRNHIIAKHGGNGKSVETTFRQADDESMASRAIQAEIDIASGLGSDDSWLLP